MSPAQVVAAARSWLGVRFEHQGRSRSGVDCAGLVICVARELGVVDPTFDVNGYTRRPDGTMFEHCDSRLVRTSRPEIGGVFVMRYATEPQHMGFFVPYRDGLMGVVHAVLQNRKVVEHRLDDVWRSRIVRTYRLPGIEA